MEVKTAVAEPNERSALSVTPMVDEFVDQEGCQSSIAAAFQQINDFVTEDQRIRERIREAVKSLEQSTRELSMLMQIAHRGTSQDGIRLCHEARRKLPAIQEKLQCLREAFPEHLHYRFNDHWRHCMQQLSYLCAFIVFLESGKLLTQHQLAEMLGVNVGNGFHVELEDMLQGFLTLASELARLAVNAVTSKDYRQPFIIADFVNSLNTGFQLLNLKNDSLRKHYDGLKYDVKKIEDVVYDLTIRGLKPV